MNRTRQPILALVLGALAAWALVTGCESTTGTDTVITVAPATADANRAGATVVFTASMGTNSMVLPLIWTVDHPELGRILSSVGVTAIYESSGVAGTSTITVRDQTTAEGLAVVYQH
jgi:hypothetical protein